MILKNTTKKRKCKKFQKNEEIEKLKNDGSLHANDVPRDFIESNGKNVEPRSAKLEEPIIERVERNPSSSLRDHFYHPQDLVLTFLLSLVT